MYPWLVFRPPFPDQGPLRRRLPALSCALPLPDRSLAGAGHSSWLLAGWRWSLVALLDRPLFDRSLAGGVLWRISGSLVAASRRGLTRRLKHGATSCRQPPRPGVVWQGAASRVRLAAPAAYQDSKEAALSPIISKNVRAASLLPISAQVSFRNTKTGRPRRGRDNKRTTPASDARYTAARILSATLRSPRQANSCRSQPRTVFVSTTPRHLLSPRMRWHV